MDLQVVIAEELYDRQAAAAPPDPDAEWLQSVGSLFRLQQRCAGWDGRPALVEAQIDACVAAAEICGGTYRRVDVDWIDAINDLIGVQRELRVHRRQRLVPASPDGFTTEQLTAANQDADGELVERIDGAIRRWEQRISEREDETLSSPTGA